MLSTALRIGRLFCLGFLLCFFSPSPLISGQAIPPTTRTQDRDLPADDIIAILQQNPDLLAEAKTQIAEQLRDKGYPISERTITDDRLFSEIRSDDRVRHAIGSELKARGFGEEERDQTQPLQQVEKSSSHAEKPDERFEGDGL